MLELRRICRPVSITTIVNRYCHTQFGWAVFLPMLVAALGGIGAALWIPAARPGASFVAGFLLIVTVLFTTLTIEVHHGGLECRFGVGLIRRRIRLEDICEAQIVRNRWWYGWGIRLTPHGWLWNVSGLNAVELTLVNGKKFRLGTDEPEKLREVLRHFRA
jgi:hypothetical protein